MNILSVRDLEELKIFTRAAPCLEFLRLPWLQTLQEPFYFSKGQVNAIERSNKHNTSERKGLLLKGPPESAPRELRSNKVRIELQVLQVADVPQRNPSGRTLRRASPAWGGPPGWRLCRRSGVTSQSQVLGLRSVRKLGIFGSSNWADPQVPCERVPWPTGRLAEDLTNVLRGEWGGGRRA